VVVRLLRIVLDLAALTSLLLCVGSVWGFVFGMNATGVGHRYVLYSQGLRLDVWDLNSPGHRPDYVIPWGLIILATAVLPVLRSRLGFRLVERRRPGLCSVCGYDLRATPDRCPECGTIPLRPERISN
jgi:hypothetical protein